MSDLSHSQIRQIAIIVHDIPKAVSFYRDTLGLRLFFDVPKMTFLDCCGVRMMLGIPETPEFDHPQFDPAFQSPRPPRDASSTDRSPGRVRDPAALDCQDARPPTLDGLLSRP